MGSLLPHPGEAPKFTQLYIGDPHAELNGRMGNFGGLNRDIMQSLQTMLHECNPYASIYQTTMERLQGEVVELSLRLLNDRRTKRGSARVTMLQFYAYILQHRINEEWIL
jgi:hypothetical protein